MVQLSNHDILTENRANKIRGTISSNALTNSALHRDLHCKSIFIRLIIRKERKPCYTVTLCQTTFYILAFPEIFKIYRTLLALCLLSPAHL